MNYRIFLFVFTILPLAVTMGQNSPLAHLINCVELQNGADNLLINGRSYTPSNLKAEGHPYFQTKDWKPGIVYLNGNTFSVNHLKYNLSTYQLIIKQERPNGTSQEIILSDLLVDSFQIEEHLFVNRDLILPEKEISSYLEKIYAEKRSFYRIQKKVLNPISNNKPYGQFIHLKDVFFLLSEKQYHKVTNKKEFWTCFPDHKTTIKKYLKDQSLKWKKMTKNQFSQLLKFCDDQV